MPYCILSNVVIETTCVLILPLLSPLTGVHIQYSYENVSWLNNKQIILAL